MLLSRYDFFALQGNACVFTFLSFEKMLDFVITGKTNIVEDMSFFRNQYLVLFLSFSQRKKII
jgi:hypothetical protein